MLAYSETIPIFPELAGKVALVTGSSRGIGATTAKYLSQNHVKVVVNGRDADALNRTVSSLQSKGAEVQGVLADCTKSEQIERMRDEVEQRFGGIDFLLGFAGGGGPVQPIESISEQDWNELIAANLTSKFLIVKSFLPGMKRRGAGAIVLMCSSAGRAASRAALAYSSAQAGVSMLARNLAHELGGAGIRVNAIAPSAIRNERIEKFMDQEEQDNLARQFAIERIGEPGDVAAAALFLCSNASSWITGTTLDVAGGKVML